MRQAWAEVSGNGQGDPSVWKRNFRSTLRAKKFKMVTNNSKDNANPIKVFRWPEEGSSPSKGNQAGKENAAYNQLIF